MVLASTRLGLSTAHGMVTDQPEGRLTSVMLSVGGRSVAEPVQSTPTFPHAIALSINEYTRSLPNVPMHGVQHVAVLPGSLRRIREQPSHCQLARNTYQVPVLICTVSAMRMSAPDAGAAMPHVVCQVKLFTENGLIHFAQSARLWLPEHADASAAMVRTRRDAQRRRKMYWNGDIARWANVTDILLYKSIFIGLVAFLEEPATTVHASELVRANRPGRAEGAYMLPMLDAQ